MRETPCSPLYNDARASHRNSVLRPLDPQGYLPFSYPRDMKVSSTTARWCRSGRHAGCEAERGSGIGAGRGGARQRNRRRVRRCAAAGRAARRRETAPAAGRRRRGAGELFGLADRIAQDRGAWRCTRKPFHCGRDIIWAANSRLRSGEGVELASLSTPCPSWRSSGKDRIVPPPNKVVVTA
jgi:hypothetical protein